MCPRVETISLISVYKVWSCFFGLPPTLSGIEYWNNTGSDVANAPQLFIIPENESE